MPSAANAKSEKPASSEATDNSPVRQIMTIIDHKIRNLEKRKSKLQSYRDLQKAGKDLNSDQKVAVAKYEEVAQTLEFSRDLAKQVTSIVSASEREAKKQAKKEAWVRYASETGKIREVLLILDCLNLMGSSEAREDFLNGSNGACKLAEADLKILDDLYPEVTPKHELTEEGQPGFHIYTTRAAEHLYAIIDGKPKEVLGTTYAHIKEIITSVHECGYFDKGPANAAVECEESAAAVEQQPESVAGDDGVAAAADIAAPPGLPVAPAPAVVPAPAYPLRPLPPITLQEVEHAYFSQQYPQPRPISEVIGSQNFFFLQESEIDSPVSTPQPPPIMNQPSPPAPIPSQTFTNQHFVQLPGGRVPDSSTIPMPPQPHFPPPPEHAAFPGVPLAPLAARALVPCAAPLHAHPAPAPLSAPAAPAADRQHTPPEEQKAQSPANDKKSDEWKESRSPEREDTEDRKTQGQGDGQGRFRRFGRGGRGTSNGFRGRGAFQSRQGGDHHNRHGGEYQGRSGKEGFQNRQYNDGYQNRHGKENYQNRGGNDNYVGNGDAADSHQQNENGGRDRYNDNQNYQGGYKGRGRGGPRGGPRGSSRPPRSQHYNRKPDNVE